MSMSEEILETAVRTFQTVLTPCDSESTVAVIGEIIIILICNVTDILIIFQATSKCSILLQK